MLLSIDDGDSVEPLIATKAEGLGGLGLFEGSRSERDAS
jgi:hypothetical protein